MYDKRNSPNRFSVKFAGNPDEQVKVAAFVFDNTGNFIERAEIDEKGGFYLKNPDTNLSHIKMFIAPVAGSKDVPNVKDMEKASAYQPYLGNLLIREDVIELLPIPPLKYKWWWMCYCRVTGRVTKPVFTGGIWQKLPVCKARVHICEVDQWPFILKYLPDDVIGRIKDELVAVRWPVIPIPDPEPYRKIEVPRINTGANLRNIAIDKVTEPRPILQQLKLQSQTDFQTLQFQLNLNNSTLQLKEILSDNFYWIRPYFCHWPWLWGYFSCDEKAVIETDNQGRFDVEVDYYCFGDKPDIYVWVEYFVDGQWVTVYNPGRACHTYWNYECGSEIDISISDSRVPGCGRADVEGEIVEILRIGSSCATSHILQRSVSQSVQGVSFDALGLTNFDFRGVAGVRYLNPFGETLNIIADFGSTLHDSAASHFRCSYKLNSAPDVGSSWTVLKNQLSRTYEDEISDGINPPFKQRKGFDLKDPTYEDLYIIPNHEASDQVGIPIPAGTLINRDWISLEFAIASIVSTGLSDGIYDFRFELFRITGSIPELLRFPKSTYQVPNPDNTLVSLPLSNTGYSSAGFPDFHAEDYLIEDGSNTANATAFTLTFRVNNAHCTAVIDNITVINATKGNTTSDTECGFAQYEDKSTSKVKFSFEAFHPENFATFSFSVVRGNGNPCPDANTGGMVIGNSSNGYLLTGGKFTKDDVDVSALLGNCTQAAFSENLYVAALATNGSVRLEGYDASDVAAFAIEPMS